MTATIDFGLSARTLDQLRGVLSRHTGIQRAIVYGSRAKGDFRPGSDIDLTLDAPGLMFDELLRINLRDHAILNHMPSRHPHLTHIVAMRGIDHLRHRIVDRA